MDRNRLGRRRRPARQERAEGCGGGVRSALPPLAAPGLCSPTLLQRARSLQKLRDPGLAQYCPQGGLSSGGRAQGSPTAGRGPWKPPPGQLCSAPRVLVPSRCSSGAYPGPQRHLGDPSLCCLSPIPPAGRLG